MVSKFLACALLASAATASAATSLIQPGFRLGARVGPSEFTPEIGLAAFVGPAYLTVDGWFQPWRFRTTEHDLVYMAQDVEVIRADIQFRERRWGFSPGVHYDLGTKNIGIVPGAGWEFSWGDWEGDTVDPPFESVAWFGGDLRLLSFNHLGFKYYPQDTRSGSWKIEYVAQFGGPKRR